MKKVKKEKAGSSKGYIIAAIIAIIIALGIWMVLVAVEDEVLSKYANNTYYAFNQDARVGTYIEDESFFTTVQLDQSAVPQNTVSNLEDIIGKYLIIDVKANQLVTDNLYEERIEGVDGTKVVSIQAAGMINASNGMIRRGDRVDMYFISPAYGEIVKEAEVTVDGVTWTEKTWEHETLHPTYENVYIMETRNGDGIRISPEDKDSLATIFTITASPEMTDEIESMMALGYTLYMVKCK